MRLSYTPICLLPVFLITFLTFFLKPGARAQSMLAANLPHHHFSNDCPVVDVNTDESVQPEIISEQYSPGVNNTFPSAVNFLRSAIPVFPIQNSRKIYTGYHPLRMRIYGPSLEHSMRITVKLFKVVIVPLW